MYLWPAKTLGAFLFFALQPYLSPPWIEAARPESLMVRIVQMHSILPVSAQLVVPGVAGLENRFSGLSIGAAPAPDGTAARNRGLSIEPALGHVGEDR